MVLAGTNVEEILFHIIIGLTWSAVGPGVPLALSSQPSHRLGDRSHSQLVAYLPSLLPEANQSAARTIYCWPCNF